MNYNVSKFRAKHNSRPLLFFLFFAYFLLPFSGLTAHAQGEALDEKITLNQIQGTMLDVIRELDRQSAFSFSYSQAQLEVIKVTSLSLNKVSLSEALKVLETRYKLIFSIQQKVISVKPPKQETKTQDSPNVQAGGGPGTIKGRVVEFETSQPLPGASVRVIELNTVVSSDNNGYYRLTGIPAGKYTLQVSYVSFTTEKVQVEAKAGKEETYDIKMQGSNQLNEVVVTSIGKTRAPVAHTNDKQLISEIKNLRVVASGISSQQISMGADRNAAEVVQRISGVSVVDDQFVIIRGLNPRYNMTYLNDNVAPSTEVNSRAFALNLIPSRIIDKILVYKSPSPENQGDATGGVLKIYTKDAKAVKHFDIEVQLGHRPGTSFNSNFLTYNGGKLDFLGIDDGTRALPASVPGYGDLRQTKLTPSQYAESFNPTLSYGRKTALPNMQVTANYYNGWKVWGKRVSMLSSMSYKNEAFKSHVNRYRALGSYGLVDRDRIDDRNVGTAQINLLQNFMLTLRDSSTISFKNFIMQQGTDNTITRISSSPYAASIDKDIILSWNQRFLYAGNLGGTHFYDKGKHKVTWNGGYTYSQQLSPDQRVIRLTTPASANESGGGRRLVGDSELDWRARGFITGSVDDRMVIPATLGIVSRIWSKNNEGVYNGSLDYEYRILPWITAKAGTFHQWKKRSMDRRLYTVHEASIDPRTIRPVGTIVPGDYLDPSLIRFRQQDLPNVWSNAYLRDDYIGLNVFDRTSGSDTYVGTEQNNSAYAALSFTPANRFVEVYGGVRYEYNRQKIAAALPPVWGNANPINIPVFINNPMQSWLPSLNISIRPMEALVLRGAAGKTLNRTEFREVSPFEELDFENNQVLYGNPQLKAASVDNYDLRLEFYPDKDNNELLSVGAFYKEIQRPIERFNSTSFVESVFPNISYINSRSAVVKGVEFELRKSFAFIPLNVFRNLSFIANLSLIHSNTRKDTIGLGDIDETMDNRRLQGQAPYLINAGLYYDSPAWGSRIAVNYNTAGDKIYAVGRQYKYNDFNASAEFMGSLFELQRHLLDIAYTQRLFKAVQLKFTVQNLLNEPERLAVDSNFSNKYEAKAKGDTQPDLIFQEFRPGRFFTLTLSYSL